VLARVRACARACGVHAAAMAARAKQRQQTSAVEVEKPDKELPPSASNPSAAMNVGKDEGQLMGMEGRAARLAAKSTASNKQAPISKPKTASAHEDR
jgi:hypothetical protein